LQRDFNKRFKKDLKKNCSNLKCNIKHSHSHNFEGLQFADIIAWSCFRKFENKQDFYLDKLKIEQEFYQIWN